MVLGIVGFVMAVPITAIMTAHRRQMAGIMLQRQSNTHESDAVMKLSQEVAELRELVHQQAILVDDLSSMHKRLLERSTPDADDVRQRLGG